MKFVFLSEYICLTKTTPGAALGLHFHNTRQFETGLRACRCVGLANIDGFLWVTYFLFPLN